MICGHVAGHTVVDVVHARYRRQAALAAAILDAAAAVGIVVDASVEGSAACIVDRFVVARPPPTGGRHVVGPAAHDRRSCNGAQSNSN